MTGLSKRLRRRLIAFAAEAGLALGLGFDRAVAWLLARRIARRCRVIAEPAPWCRDPTTALVFSAFRFWEDLDLLKADGRLRMIEAPTGDLQAIGSLFRTRPALAPQEHYLYFTETDPAILAARARLERLARLVLGALRRRLPIDCALTPAVHYEYEFPWAAAAHSIGLPFIALHKEFTLMDRRNLPVRIERFRRQKRRFYGTRVLVANELARELFVASEMARPELIEVVGLPRMDRLFDPESPYRCKHTDQRQVTLFSFGHYSGDLHPGDRRSKLFSRLDHEGFVRLFRDVHAAMAELALAHSDVRFLIKPKTVADWWIVEIERVVREATGRGLDDIANCEIVDGSAQQLIRDSDAVIGFNSTVLLESKVLGRPTIVPVFAEAVDTYPDNVYIRDDLDIFFVARSKDDLKAGVERVLDGGALAPEAPPDRVRDVLTAYLGFDDAGSTRRVVDAVRTSAASAALRQPAS